MQLTNDIELFEQPENSTLKVFNAVTVTQGKNCVIVEVGKDLLANGIYENHY